MLKIFAAFIVLIIAFIIWRWTSVARGAQQRDEKLLTLLHPIGQKLHSGDTVSPEEVAALAARPELRYVLFTMLRALKRPDLLPSAYSSSIAQGESALTYWMMHPNELQAAPEAIEHVETVKRLINGTEADFHIYRYKMATGHWAAKDGWILGLAGPMHEDAEPYTTRPGAFSRAGDFQEKVKPSELVDWYVGMLRQKGMIS